jgi:hypothetical protein
MGAIMPIEAILPVVGGLLSASSAKKAASAQTDAAGNQLALYRDIYNQTRQDNRPRVKLGNTADKILAFELGLSDKAPIIGAQPLKIRTVQRPVQNGLAPSVIPGTNIPTGGGAADTRTQYRVGGKAFWNKDRAQMYARKNGDRGTRYTGYSDTREYRQGMRAGVGAIDASAASQGLLESGRTAKALTQFGSDYQTGFRNNYLGQLAGVSSNGLVASGANGNAGANFAAGGSAAIGNAGNATSAGYIGSSNALNDALGQFYGAWQYQKGLAQ